MYTSVEITWKSSIDSFFTGWGLYEVRSSLHADHRSLVNVFHCTEFTNGQNSFHMSCSTSLLHLLHLIENSFPVTLQSLNTQWERSLLEWLKLTYVRLITMSISRAPSATASRISSRRRRSGVWPAGKPVATEATGKSTPAALSHFTALLTWFG